MKYFIVIISFVFISCSDNSQNETKEEVEILKINPLGLCDNEIELLKSDAEEKINFDFNTYLHYYDSSSGEFDFIEKQTNVDLCMGPWNFSTDVSFDTNEIININLLADKYCEGRSEIVRACPYIEEILINDSSQVLMEGQYIANNNSLVYSMKEIFYDDYIISEYYKHNKKTFFSIQWDKGTPIKDRVYVFESMIKAYLMVANKVSKLMFKKQLCDLNLEKVKKLKSVFSFNLLIQTHVIPKIPVK